MITRQRVLLSILREAGGKASRMQVVKWAFLLCNEAVSQGGSAFYEFLPYKYGPFSFCLFQEASGLVRSGLLREVDEKDWALEAEGSAVATQLAPSVQEDVRRIVSRPASKRLSTLTAYVYERYPWFTVNSEREQRTIKPVAQPKIFTMGYEGMSLDGFLNGLLQAGIKCIIDVRSNPVSRRYGFHKTTLSRISKLVGIDYVHHPELGVPSESRRHLHHPEAYNALFRFYDQEVLEKQVQSLEEVSARLREHPSVLLCREADATFCHRSRLAIRLHDVTGLDTQHLEIGG